MYIWCKNDVGEMVFKFKKGISGKDILDYIKSYNYDSYKEITRKQYRLFKKNFINKTEI